MKGSITLDKEEREILNKAVEVLSNMGSTAQKHGNISLFYENISDPVCKNWEYSGRDLYDFANLLAALAYRKKINIVVK